MSDRPDQPPILEAARYSWRFTAATLVPTLPAYLVRAVISGATTAAMFSSLNGGVLPFDLLASIIGFAVTIACMALTLRLALGGEIKGMAGLQFGMDEGRLLSAHAIFYALFVFLGFIALFVVIVAFTPVFAMMMPDLEAVADDPVAFQAAVEDFFRSAPGIALSLAILAATSVPLFYLSARLVAFPAATLMRKKIMIFETWSWTKGSVLPVVAAMLLTLAPLWVLSIIGVFIASGVTGVPVLFGGMASATLSINPLMGFVFGFVTSLFSIPFTIAAAGLSAFMYRGFEPDRNAF